MEIKVEGKLLELATQVHDLYKAQPMDKRKKEYKDSEKQINDLVALGESIIVKDAIEFMAKLGYNFELVEKPIVAKLKYPDGFTVYIRPNFRAKYWNDAPSVSWVVSDNAYDARWTSNAWIWSSDENFETKVKGVIEKEHQEFTEKNRVGNVNENHATNFMNKIGEDWTGRSGDYMFQGENRPWAGSEVELEYEDRSRSFSNTTRAKVEFYREKFVSHFDFRVEFDTEEEALVFWNKAKEFVESTTKYVRKQRRE